jgi:TatD DNase family protein
MPLVDVHCHLNHKELIDNIEEVLANAVKAGLKVIVLSGVNPKANKNVLELAKKYPMVKASLGMYPIDILGLSPDEIGLPHHKGPIDLDSEFAFIREHLDSVISIGEIGMDFFWASKEETGEAQIENFRKIVRFAIEVKKPIVIHSRKAEAECLDVLEKEIKNNEIPVVHHCFGGRKSLMKRGVELGHYFSIPANIKRNTSFEALVKIVPLDKLLTETDAPWQSPFKGKVNEPAYVTEAIKKIAEVKEITEKEAEDLVWDNFCKVFSYNE